MARLTQLRPMIEVQDLESTVAFWRDALGFSVVATFDDSWCLMERDGLRVMFNLHAHDHAHDQGAVSLYLDTDDVDGLYAEVSANAPVHGPPQTFPWGMRQFAITDCNGLLVQFGQPVE
jgi:uncharacterized glyoxalase superfamily protein PhnB